MIDLDTIFDNIDEYSNNIDDLVKALKQAGIKSFEEFRDAGSRSRYTSKEVYTGSGCREICELRGGRLGRSQTH